MWPANWLIRREKSRIHAVGDSGDSVHSGEEASNPVISAMHAIWIRLARTKRAEYAFTIDASKPVAQDAG